MSIVSEDGTGIVGAETYATVAFADAYYAARTHLALYTTWDAATTSFKEGALREATAYVDAQFGVYYRGVRQGRLQGLLWPRSDALDDAGYPLHGLPVELQQAVCELAGRSVSAPLADDEARGGKIKRLKAGSVEIEYADGAEPGTVYGIVNSLLAPILDGTQSAMPKWEWL